MRNLWSGNATGRAGYGTMTILCHWEKRGGKGEEHRLKVAFSYSNSEGAAVRCEDSSLEGNLGLSTLKEHIPSIAYLPHLSSMSSAEPLYTPPFVESKVAAGNSGEVLRNLLYKINDDGFKKLCKILEEPPFGVPLEKISFEESADVYLPLETG